MLRILQAGDLPAVGATLARLERHEFAGVVTREARTLLAHLFGTTSSHGVAMAVLATVGVEEPATIRASWVALAAELLRCWEEAPAR